MKKLTTITSALILAALAGLSACSSTDPGTNNALPQADETSVAATTKAATTKTKAAAPAKPKASSCDVAREAILTGTPSQIKAAMKTLQADKKADADAREAARNYLKETNTDLKDMYVQMVQLSCSI